MLLWKTNELGLDFHWVQITPDNSRVHFASSITLACRLAFLAYLFHYPPGMFAVA